jgi:hypothetical protein
MTSRVLAALAAAAILACNTTEPSQDSITATVDHSSYTPPSVVQVVLTNGSSETVHTGVCPWLERHEGGAWTAIHTQEACPAVLMLIEAGQRASVYIDIPAGMPPGEYRGATGVGGWVPLTVTTQPFQVE